MLIMDVMAGDGKGNFSYIKQNESGFNIWGDVRSSIQINDKIIFGINGKDLVAYSFESINKVCCVVIVY